MARAYLPLNPAAVAAANTKMHKRTEPPGRILSATDPADASLRVEWMRAYAAAGGSVYEDQSSAGVRDVVIQCVPPRPPDWVPADFVTFRLIDPGTKAAIPSVALRIRHPDGTVKRHSTDSAGMVSIPGITGTRFEVLSIGDPIADGVEVVSTVNREAHG